MRGALGQLGNALDQALPEFARHVVSHSVDQVQLGVAQGLMGIQAAFDGHLLVRFAVDHQGRNIEFFESSRLREIKVLH